MPDDEISWAVELTDEISGPAAKMSAGLEAVAKGYKDVAAAASAADSALRASSKAAISNVTETDPNKILADLQKDRAAHAPAASVAAAVGAAPAATPHEPPVAAVPKKAKGPWYELEKAIENVNAKLQPGALTIAGVMAAVDAVEALISGFVRLGEKIVSATFEAHDFGVKVEAAFSVVEKGNLGAAAGDLKELHDQAKAGGVAQESLLKTTLHLRNLGFQAQTVRAVLAGGLSLGAANANPEAGIAAMEKLVSGLEKARMSDKGKFGKGAFTGLEHLGISADDIEAQLAKVYGSTEAKAKQKLTHGLVGEGDAIEAALLAIQAKVERGGKLGALQADVAAKTVGGGMNALKVSLDEMLESVNVSPVLDFLTHVREMLESPASGEALKGLLDEVFGVLSKITVSDLQTAFQDGVAAAKTLVNAVKAIGDAIGAVISAYKDLKNLFGSDSGRDELAGNKANEVIAQLDKYQKESGRTLTKQEALSYFDAYFKQKDASIGGLGRANLEQHFGTTPEQLTAKARKYIEEGSYDPHFAEGQEAAKAKREAAQVARDMAFQAGPAGGIMAALTGQVGPKQISTVVNVGGVVIKTDGDPKAIGEGVGGAIKDSAQRGTAEVAQHAATELGAK